jgi:thiol:disulfide interchange protein
MPLSEEEQRIIKEMERHLLNEDRDFVSRVQSETIYKHLGRKLLLGVIGVIIGLIWLIYFLQVSVAAAFVGFIIMIAFALWMESNLRKLSKVSVEEVSNSIKHKKIWEDIKEVKEGFIKRFKGRFNK